LIAEVGTAQFGMLDAVFPANTLFNTQIFWSSIGFSVPATLGACVAAKELKRPGRVVLIVGDGSLQMTVQEVGSLIRFGFKPIIFVINNNGYSIERAIHGPDQQYNDISLQWNYQKMLEFFGGSTTSTNTGFLSRSSYCGDIEDVERTLGSEEFGHSDCIEVGIDSATSVPFGPRKPELCANNCLVL
jgi:pyruvate decarboxylase